jgi:signal transduction histidine kinase
MPPRWSSATAPAGSPDLAENIDASLDAVEEILTALLEISRLDGGALKPEITAFRVDELMRQLQREFEPSAQEKGSSSSSCRPI